MPAARNRVGGYGVTVVRFERREHVDADVAEVAQLRALVAAMDDLHAAEATARKCLQERLDVLEHADDRRRGRRAR